MKLTSGIVYQPLMEGPYRGTSRVNRQSNAPPMSFGQNNHQAPDMLSRDETALGAVTTVEHPPQLQSVYPRIHEGDDCPHEHYNLCFLRQLLANLINSSCQIFVLISVAFVIYFACCALLNVRAVFDSSKFPCHHSYSQL